MRDRLDELIDTYHSARKLADACFRHGVEQHIAYMRGDLATEPASRVQPAPAECKGHIHGGYRVPGTVCTCAPGVEEIRVCSRGTDGVLYFDRRSGPRRKKP
jgi:hypothetical protein